MRLRPPEQPRGEEQIHRSRIYPRVPASEMLRHLSIIRQRRGLKYQFETTEKEIRCQRRHGSRVRGCRLSAAVEEMVAWHVCAVINSLRLVCVGAALRHWARRDFEIFDLGIWIDQLLFQDSHAGKAKGKGALESLYVVRRLYKRIVNTIYAISSTETNV